MLIQEPLIEPVKREPRDFVNPTNELKAPTDRTDVPEAELTSISSEDPLLLPAELPPSLPTGLPPAVPVSRSSSCSSLSSSDLSDVDEIPTDPVTAELKTNTDCIELENNQSSFVFHSNFLSESNIRLSSQTSSVLEEPDGADVSPESSVHVEEQYGPLMINVGNHSDDEDRRESNVSDVSSGLGTPSFARLPPEGRENPDQFINGDGAHHQQTAVITDLQKDKDLSHTASDLKIENVIETSKEEPLSDVLPPVTTTSAEAPEPEITHYLFPQGLQKRSSSFTNISTIGATKGKSATLPPSAKPSDMDPFLTSPRTWTDFNKTTSARRASIGSVSSDDGDKKTFAPPLQFTRRESMIDKLDKARRESAAPRLKGLNIPGRRTSTSQMSNVLPVLKPLKAFTPINYKPVEVKARTGVVRERPRSMIERSTPEENATEATKPKTASVRSSMFEESRKLFTSAEKPLNGPTNVAHLRASISGPILRDDEPDVPSSLPLNVPMAHDAMCQPPTNDTITTSAKPKIRPPVPKKPVVAPKPKMKPADIVIKHDITETSKSNITSPLSPTSALPRPYRPVTSPNTEDMPLSPRSKQIVKDYSLKSPAYREGPKPFGPSNTLDNGFDLTINTTPPHTMPPNPMSPDSATGSTGPTDHDVLENKSEGDLCDVDRMSVDSGLYGSKNNLLDTSTDRCLSPDSSRLTSGDEGSIKGSSGSKTPDEVERKVASPILSDTDSGIVPMQTEAHQKCKFL